MADSKVNADIATMSYEQARDELAKVLSDLEAGAVTLEQSMTLWERGEALTKRCEEWLSGARKRVDEALKEK
jgi:exodeoxyribonuclease VII small subunit